MSGDPQTRNGLEAARNTVMAYHVRTRHEPGRFARSLGYLDWANQPDPFRHYAGAPRVALPLPGEPAGAGPGLDACFAPAPGSGGPLDLEAVSRLLYFSFGLSAEKQHGRARWFLRCNPSSGNLHPLEAYLLLGEAEGSGLAAGLYHYCPREHVLERLRDLSPAGATRVREALGGPGLLLLLTGICWRTAWKYGERAYRYVHLDAGHAAATAAHAARLLGWQPVLLAGLPDEALCRLAGVSAQQGPEAEVAVCGLGIRAAAGVGGEAAAAAEQLGRWHPTDEALADLAGDPVPFSPSRLSAEHHAWPVIEAVHRATGGPALETAAATAGGGAGAAAAKGSSGLEETVRALLAAPPAAAVLRRRRSAQAMDGEHWARAEDLAALLGPLATGAPEWLPGALFPWGPLVHPVALVHRVRGVRSGAYLLLRPGADSDALQDALRPDFSWAAAGGLPAGIDLRQLEVGDLREAAFAACCRQDIAADGVLAVYFLGEVEAALARLGPWGYRALHWEAGALGQALYLAAEARGLRGTGIGCFFDDEIHRWLGLTGRGRQVLYAFTVGAPLEDRRIRTRDPYADRRG